ncbi:hypothetical protein M758_3G080200 [Ceratodon purpureus]|nr:hypothetical protein M758_3G080200 [Ceratodon purpureus]
MAYLDVRQPGSPVGSLRNFGMRCERDHGFPCNEVENEEDDSEVSHQSVHSRVTHLVEDGQFHLFDRDWNQRIHLEAANSEEPLAFSPSLLRRSNSSNYQH